jgi:hypothetical protein
MITQSMLPSNFLILQCCLMKHNICVELKNIINFFVHQIKDDPRFNQIEKTFFCILFNKSFQEMLEKYSVKFQKEYNNNMSDIQQYQLWCNIHYDWVTINHITSVLYDQRLHFLYNIHNQNFGKNWCLILNNIDEIILLNHLNICYKFIKNNK